MVLGGADAGAATTTIAELKLGAK